jgi:hypothetical protein
MDKEHVHGKNTKKNTKNNEIMSPADNSSDENLKAEIQKQQAQVAEKDSSTAKKETPTDQAPIGQHGSSNNRDIVAGTSPCNNAALDAEVKSSQTQAAGIVPVTGQRTVAEMKPSQSQASGAAPVASQRTAAEVKTSQSQAISSPGLGLKACAASFEYCSTRGTLHQKVMARLHANNPSHGRGVFATGEVASGEVIVREASVKKMLMWGEVQRRCFHCHCVAEPGVVLRACSRCKVSHYCTHEGGTKGAKTCQRKDWDEHKRECAHLAVLSNGYEDNTLDENEASELLLLSRVLWALDTGKKGSTCTAGIASLLASLDDACVAPSSRNLGFSAALAMKKLNVPKSATPELCLKLLTGNIHCKPSQSSCMFCQH